MCAHHSHTTASSFEKVFLNSGLVFVILTKWSRHSWHEKYERTYARTPLSTVLPGYLKAFDCSGTFTDSEWKSVQRPQV